MTKDSKGGRVGKTTTKLAASLIASYLEAESQTKRTCLYLEITHPPMGNYWRNPF